MSLILNPRAAPLHGAVAVPGDKSITHRVLMMAPLASGPCRVRGWLDAADTRRTMAAMSALGAAIREQGDELVVAPGTFPAPAQEVAEGEPLPLDCGNSATTARLLAGLVCGRRARVVLDGDASLRGRPMGRVARPLKRLQGRLDFPQRPGRLPCLVTGAPLRGASCQLAVPSAQVKSAILLAGLAADGPVQVGNCGVSRDHTERLLGIMGADLAVDDQEGGRVTVQGGRPLDPFDVAVPGDPSSAAFLLAAAALRPGSELTVRGISLNPTRTGFLRVLEAMGAPLAVAPDGDDGWEPRGDVTVGSAPLRPFRLGPDEIPALIDELPMLCVLAAAADGVSLVRGAGELRVKESDRIKTMTVALRAYGVPVLEQPDGLLITGPVNLGQGSGRVRLRTAGDHRVAMALAVAAGAARCETVLDDVDCVNISFPGFFDLLAAAEGEGR